jgi:hypothetical protein
VLVRRTPGDRRSDSVGDQVEEAGARLTQLEAAEQPAGRVAVEVPVEEHARVTEPAAELVDAVRVRPLM